MLQSNHKKSTLDKAPAKNGFNYKPKFGLIILLAIVAIATAVGVAAYMIHKHWGSIAPKATQLWQDVKNAFDAGKNYLTNTWQTIKNGATDIWGRITQGVSSGIERIKQIIIGIDTIFAENPLLNLLIPFIGIPRMIIANWKEIGGFFTGSISNHGGKLASIGLWLCARICGCTNCW